MTQENTARVITIAATEQPQNIQLRVAAYARVSSSSDEQLNSFAAQNRYYTELISGKDNWQLVDIYADEGITGTSIEKRDDFKRMLRDCERGLIDKILVKSISRFARNTTECLETVRSLKARGVSVYFEKEGIDTGKVSGEMLTAVFASLAQAESESISKNVKWGIGKRMRDGTFNTCCAPVGFHLENGKLAVVEEARHVIAKIYEDYLNGLNSREIAAALNRENMIDRRWSRELVDYILTNERYVLLDMEYESLANINALAHAAGALSTNDIKKLGAAVTLAKPQNAEQVKNLAENLDLFDFAPGAHSPAEYGKYMIQQSGHYEFDENLDEFYDYEGYALQRMNDEDGMFTDRGYIAYKGCISLGKVMESSQSDSMEMGRM